MRTSMAPQKSRAATTIRFSMSGTPAAFGMGILVAVDHEGIDGQPDRGEKRRHRREKGDGPLRDELLTFLRHAAIFAKPTSAAMVRKANTNPKIVRAGSIE